MDTQSSVFVIIVMLALCLLTYTAYQVGSLHALLYEELNKEAKEIEQRIQGTFDLVNTRFENIENFLRQATQ